MNSFDQKMPKPLNRDYGGGVRRTPKEKRPATRESASDGTAQKLSLTALICGIASIVLLFTPIPFSVLFALVCGIIAVVTGKKAKTDEGVNGMNKAGFVCGIIGLVLIGLLLLALIALFAIGAEFIGSMGGISGIQDMFGSMIGGMGTEAGSYVPPDVYAEDASLFSR